MQLIQSGELPVHTDLELISHYLPMRDSHLLESGCGAAFTARKIAEQNPGVQITATEVDKIQHEKNLNSEPLPNLQFKLAGMQEIPVEDNSLDGVFMLKSLHHVPPSLLDEGFAEIHRVLKTGGLLYLSEPVFAGEFNEILRLFNDEQEKRATAFDAIKKAVASGLFELEKEIHFSSISRFQGFEEFESRIIGATHSNFDVDEALLLEIRSRFLPHLNAEGMAEFVNPMRVDLLRKS